MAEFPDDDYLTTTRTTAKANLSPKPPSRRQQVP